MDNENVEGVDRYHALGIFNMSFLKMLAPSDSGVGNFAGVVKDTTDRPDPFYEQHFTFYVKKFIELKVHDKLGLTINDILDMDSSRVYELYSILYDYNKEEVGKNDEVVKKLEKHF